MMNMDFTEFTIPMSDPLKRYGEENIKKDLESIQGHRLDDKGSAILYNWDEVDPKEVLKKKIDEGIERLKKETEIVRPPIPIHELYQKWLSGIRDTPGNKFPEHLIEEEKDFDHDIIETVEFHEKSLYALYRTAESIAQRMIGNRSLIIQAAHDFANYDVPFAMCIVRNKDDSFDVFSIDADWEYYSINQDETKWKPCYPGEHLLYIKEDPSGEKIESAIQFTLRQTPGEDVSAMRFFQYTIHDDECVDHFVVENPKELAYRLFEFLKKEYYYTPFDFLRSNPTFTLDQAIEEEVSGGLSYNTPNELYDCKYYVIYEGK